jgi:Protein of unknown function (DUF3128)
MLCATRDSSCDYAQKEATKDDTMNMQPDDVVKIGEFWNEWSRCHTFKHQRDQLYRFGKMDDCSKQWNDYKKVLRAKFCRDADEAKQLVESTHLYQERSTSSTAGVIWQLKEKPSWD